ncbi:MAG: M50 family metallopeptidase [Sphingopyxis sp.]|jgi:regulator of sigma E protease|nr:M50 family metallopeptidase [Sphingopyxis sp.]
MLDQPSVLFSVAAFIAVLGPLVFLHELGHYLVGRWCGIRAETFAIGFGREVLGWTDKRGTRWKVGWLPLGGYVQFAGDADGASTPHEVTTAEPEGSFAAAALWKRALTVAAGPAANFLVAIAILAAFALVYGRVDTPPVADRVEAGSAAAAAGILPGDRIVSIDGRAVDSFTDIPMMVMHRPGEAMTVVLRRGQDTQTVTLTPRLVAETDRFGNRIERAVIGIRNGDAVTTPVSVPEAPVVAAGQAWAMTRQMAEVIGQLVTGNRSIKDLGGPVRIAKASGEQASQGWASYAFFVALISLNLGFVNLLPLPMLDGGHLVFYAAEAVRRRPISISAQQWAFRAGFAMIAVLTIVVTFNDLSSLGLWQRLAGLIG